MPATSIETFRSQPNFPFNRDNQLAASNFQYDGNGNPTTYSGLTGMTFDPENHLTSVPGMMQAGYDSEGLRAWKQGSNTQGPTPPTYFLYDGDTAIVEEDINGNVLAWNGFGADGLWYDSQLSRKAVRVLNITDYLHAAQEQMSQWSPSAFRQTLDVIKDAFPSSFIDWDDGAGEDWGSVESDDVYAIVRTDLPLVILFGGLHERLQSQLEDAGIVVVLATEWTSEEFELDLDVAYADFPHWVWGLPPEDAHGVIVISAADLWFMTI